MSECAGWEPDGETETVTAITCDLCGAGLETNGDFTGLTAWRNQHEAEHLAGEHGGF